jgi:recombination protein RecT
VGTTERLKNQLQARNNAPGAVGVTIRQLLDAPTIKKRFEEVLKDRAPQYMSSIINLVNSDTNLQKCDPMSVIRACMVAATLNLPIDKNLGYAWVIPYGNRAQFQLGYKGYVQLALRTGQYRYINVIEVYKGELKKFNRLTEELEFDESARESDEVIGYAAYFELLNGFKKTVYWTVEQVLAHRDRFSKQKDGKVWREDFDAMAKKTVLKSLLSKWGILSVEMQRAFTDDDNAVQVSDDGNLTTIDLSPAEYSETPETSAAEESSATQEPQETEQAGLDIGDGEVIDDSQI